MNNELLRCHDEKHSIKVGHAEIDFIRSGGAALDRINHVIE